MKRPIHCVAMGGRSAPYHMGKKGEKNPSAWLGPHFLNEPPLYIQKRKNHPKEKVIAYLT